jgi:hypothetical protein
MPDKEVAPVMNTTLIGADRACSPERAIRTAVGTGVWTTFGIKGLVMAGVTPAQYQGTTVSGVSLQGTGLGGPAFVADVTARVRKGVPAGTTTSSSPPV